MTKELPSTSISAPTKANNSLLRNSAMLVVGSLVGNTLGLVFWILIGRDVDATTAGFLAVIVSASSLISVLCSLGFSTGLIRFLPIESDSKNDMINYAISWNLVVTLALGAALLLPISLFVEGLTEELASPMLVLLTVIMFTTASNAIMIDAAFIGSLRSDYVMMRNIGSSVTRVLLVPALLGFGLVGLVASYAISSLALLVVSLLVLLPVSIPAFVPSFRIRRHVETKLFASYSLRSYPADLFSSFSGSYYPMFVASTLGTEHAAFFFISWSIGSVLFLVPSALTTSFLAEASKAPAKSMELRRATAFWGTAALTAATGAMIVFGKSILDLFGSLNSSESYLTLVIVCVSGYPMLAMKIRVTELRLANQLRSVTLANGVILSGGLLLILPLVVALGTAGASLAWLISQMLGLAAVEMFSRSLSRRAASKW